MPRVPIGCLWRAGGWLYGEQKKSAKRFFILNYTAKLLTHRSEHVVVSNLATPIVRDDKMIADGNCAGT